jgi:hypothetical protein
LQPTLSPAQGASQYTEHVGFAFVATSASSSTVTIQVQTDTSTQLAVLPAYKANDGTTAAGSGDVVVGGFYVAYYCAASGSLPDRLVLK